MSVNIESLLVEVAKHVKKQKTKKKQLKIEKERMADSCVWMDSGVESLERQLNINWELRQQKYKNSF